MPVVLIDHIIIAHPSAIDKVNFLIRMCVHMKEYSRDYYEDLFSDYPDVVTLPEFMKMLGGIGEITARKLMQGNHVQHFYIRATYLIPKTSVIDYVLSEHYAEYSKKLKAKV